MPELPEVEVVRRGLAPLAGSVVESVEVFDERAITRHAGGAADFEARLTGAVLGEPARRGKFLWIPLGHRRLPASGQFPPQDTPEAGNQSALLVHLGMSGQLLVDEEPLAHRHERVRIGLGARVLVFRDQRTFGSLAIDRLVPAADRWAVPAADRRAVPIETAAGTRLRRAGQSSPIEQVPVQVAHIARDPLDSAFDDRAFIRRLRAKRTEVKRALLDQTLISGVGNIYADETLWGARIHPRQPTATLSAQAAGRLLGEVRLVMERALAEGGTSFDSLYVNVNGESGYFSRSLHAYAQDGEPCSRCGTLLVRETFMNRGSHFCPVCQRLR